MGRKAKFTKEQVKEIRYLSSRFTDEEVLAQYPMSKKTLYFIQEGKGAYALKPEDIQGSVLPASLEDLSSPATANNEDPTIPF